MGTKTIAVRVGAEPSNQDFTVHENLLIRSSPFFKAALGREFKEAKDRIVYLPESNAHAFRVYVQWLYTSQLHTKLIFDLPTNQDSQWEWAILVKARLLGDCIQDIDFQDTVIDAMAEWANEAPKTCNDVPAHSSVEVYGNTKDDSPLRRILVDFTAYRLISGTATALDKSHYPSDYLTSVVGVLTERIRSNRIATPPYVQNKGGCHYHSHGDKVCYKLKAKATTTQVYHPGQFDVFCPLTLSGWRRCPWYFEAYDMTYAEYDSPSVSSFISRIIFHVQVLLTFLLGATVLYIDFREEAPS